MTTEEIEALQLGDIIQFPDLKYAEVKSINNVDYTISLRMLSGDTSMATGELPPDMQNVDTLCVCSWADLNAAVFISGAPPLANKTFAPFIGKLEVFEAPPPNRRRGRRGVVFAETNAVPEPLAVQVAPQADGDLTEEGTVLPAPIEGEAFSDTPPPQPTP